MRTRVSVIVSCYNGAKYIVEQLQSILDQSRSADEVLIGDDGSRDETVSLIEAFIRDNGLAHWKLIVNPQNLGYGENFYRLMSQATGDVILLSDQDDIWVHDRLEKMAAFMEDHPEIGVLNTASINFRDGETLPEPQETREELHKIALNCTSYFLRYPGCVMSVSKAFFDKVRDLWNGSWAHDTFLWALAMLHDCCYYTEYVSLLRRFHSGQTSGKIGHSYAKRVNFLENNAQNGMQLYEQASRLDIGKDKLRIYRKMAKCGAYRLKLVKGRKIWYAIPLLFYLKYYQARRSYLSELKLAVMKR